MHNFLFVLKCKELKTNEVVIIKKITENYKQPLS